MAGRMNVCRRSALYGVMLVIVAIAAASPNSTNTETLTIEQRLEQLQNEINQLKEMQARQQTEQALTQQELDSYRRQAQAYREALSSPFDRLHIGGYGEIKANFTQGSDADYSDLNRLVLEIGYDFADWITFFSEWEVEHALVQDTADGSNGGYFLIEQAYFDFLLSDMFNIRAGRILTPLGIINKKHEPDTFLGVNRPSFTRYIIPTTWPADGVGVFGTLSPRLSYEAYAVSSLDGSKFNAVDGIRPGRLRERPSFNDAAVTGRLDYYPDLDPVHDLRLGASAFFGGLNNGNRGRNPGIHGDISITSADFEYSVDKWDFRGVIAHTRIGGAREIGNGTASEMFGWYLESGYHFWPEAFKIGKLADSDAVAFVRYDKFDTQYKMPSGIAADPAGDRNEWTFGMNFYFTPTVVFKTDYQMQKNAVGDKLNRLNFGLGFSF